jgi:hypothetical protein
MILYINNERVPVSANPNVNADSSFNTAGTPIDIGRYNSAYLNGYLAEFHSVDGTALAPTDFGEYNADGVWVPKNVSGVTYGTNGFYLDFSDSGNIGADRSGNGNNFTPSGFELSNTTSVDYDWMTDSPTDNYATWNPLFRSNTIPTYTKANLTVTGATSPVEGTVGVSEGKWYYEAIMTGGGSQIVGICGPVLNRYSGNLYDQSTAYVYQFQGYKGHNATLTAYGASYGNNDVVGVAFDADAGSITFYKNGSSQGVAFTGISGTFLPAVSNNGNNASHNINAGQKPFAHTPPAGFEPWSTAKMPDVAITNPSEHFNVVTWSGNGASPRQITGVGHQPDFVWIKSRSNSEEHYLADSIRGAYAFLSSNSTGTQNSTTTYDPMSSFDSDGFTVRYTTTGGNTQNMTNTSGYSYVAWCWNAGDGSPVSNTNGTVTSTVKANQEAGFSIVTWNGNSTNNTRVGHGLSQPPELIFFKNRDVSVEWPVYAKPIGIDKILYLNHNYDQGNAGSGVWGSEQQPPTSTVFSVGTATASNANRMVAYCWHSVPGFSQIGSYQGNNSSNGPFIYLGFRPAAIWVKRIDGVGSWLITDDQRDLYNPSYHHLRADLADQEVASSLGSLDILSNGFKYRDNWADSNDSNQYLYMAFAEHPFGGGNVAPSPAR